MKIDNINKIEKEVINMFNLIEKYLTNYNDKFNDEENNIIGVNKALYLKAFMDVTFKKLIDSGIVDNIELSEMLSEIEKIVEEIFFEK